ncbi:MAG TPA: hypothetical protein VEQ42_11065, partial [Pyrinomonadaceae bacterium]|nr:hypothetical protein [Pyrinomonadaceae bacterium]
PEMNPILVASMTRIRGTDPKLTEMLMGPDGTRYMAVFGVYFLLLLGFFFISLVWAVLGWGAYREINGLSKQRSFAAGMIAVVLGLLALPFMLLIQHVIG